MAQPHGGRLGADLYHLYLVGTVLLPHVAEQYDRAANGLTLLDAGVLEGAISRPADLGGPQGPAYQPWWELGHELRQCLVNSGHNLLAVADGVLRAMHAYAAADQQASDELAARIRDSLVGPSHSQRQEVR